MSYNYTQFVANLANTLVVSATDANYLQELPNIIDDAEQRIYRELQLLATITRDQSGVLTPNNRNFTFPQHYTASESVNVFTPQGSTTNRIQLVPVAREFLDNVYGNEAASTTPSVPIYYAMITDQTIIVGPSPDAAYTLEVIGTIRPAPLSAINPTTYLTTYLPDVFFAGCLVFGFGYLNNFGAMSDNPQTAVSWEAHFNSLLASADKEEAQKKYASFAWSSKAPIPISTPQRT